MSVGTATSSATGAFARVNPADSALVARAERMRLAGMRCREIAAVLGVTYQKVDRWSTRRPEPRGRAPEPAPRPDGLSARQVATLARVRVSPCTVDDVAEALSIEWPTARWYLDSLTRRDLLVEVHGYPTTWEAA